MCPCRPLSEFCTEEVSLFLTIQEHVRGLSNQTQFSNKIGMQPRKGPRRHLAQELPAEPLSALSLWAVTRPDRNKTLLFYGASSSWVGRAGNCFLFPPVWNQWGSNLRWLATAQDSSMLPWLSKEPLMVFWATLLCYFCHFYPALLPLSSASPHFLELKLSPPRKSLHKTKTT